jgi:hypothetical protein
LPGTVLPEGWAQIPPDLAVEVVSPNDLYEELVAKSGPLRCPLTARTRRVIINIYVEVPFHQSRFRFALKPETHGKNRGGTVASPFD